MLIKINQQKKYKYIKFDVQQFPYDFVKYCLLILFIQLFIITNKLMSFLKNVRGGGLHYVSDFTTTQTKMFRGGLRHYSENQEKLIYGTTDMPMAYHDKMDYQRGNIVHSRSPSNQYFNFHYFYGGFKKYTWDRWFINHYYRRNIRTWWLPFVLCYSFGCFTMRLYDNAAHDFFYFTD